MNTLGMKARNNVKAGPDIDNLTVTPQAPQPDGSVQLHQTGGMKSKTTVKAGPDIDN